MSRVCNTKGKENCNKLCTLIDRGLTVLKPLYKYTGVEQLRNRWQNTGFSPGVEGYIYARGESQNNSYVNALGLESSV